MEIDMNCEKKDTRIGFWADQIKIHLKRGDRAWAKGLINEPLRRSLGGWGDYAPGHYPVIHGALVRARLLRKWPRSMKRKKYYKYYRALRISARDQESKASFLDSHN